MSAPVTSLHYTPNDNLVNGEYTPGADGFNLADVSSVDDLNSLPPGVMVFVHLGQHKRRDRPLPIHRQRFHW